MGFSVTAFTAGISAVAAIEGDVRLYIWTAVSPRYAAAGRNTAISTRADVDDGPGELTPWPSPGRLCGWTGHHPWRGHAHDDDGIIDHGAMASTKAKLLVVFTVACSSAAAAKAPMMVTAPVVPAPRWARPAGR